MASPSSNSRSLVDSSYQHEEEQHQKPAIDAPIMTEYPFLVRHEFNNIDELGEVGRSWNVDFRQLNRGGFHGSVIQAATPELQIGRVRLQGVIHQRGSTPKGLRTFAIPTIRDIDLRWRGHEVNRDCVLVFPKSGELESISQLDFDMLIVSVTEDDLEAALRRLGIPGSSALMHGLEMVCCRESKLGRLRRRTGEILTEVEKDPPLLNDRDYSGRAAIKLSDLIVRALVTASCEHGHHRKSRQRRLVEHAICLAHGDAQAIHSVAELSKESGASVRTLRRGFQERFGVSPKAYLLAQRLGGARRDLRSANQPQLITDVANSWGFWHMGQFAADYRAMFQELPSETLRENTETQRRRD
ncbi:MAG: hypothetical protein DRJ61_17670 [Acidobacteria bacterium]|nr:MAG: hypothetical protein DRJ61_17670 [Acidobacteriota bacterium]